MTLDSPLPFRDAILQLAQKDLLPTNMSSAELRQLDASIRQRSLFSARTFMTDYLATLKDEINRILNPETTFGGVSGPRLTPATTGRDYATARLELRKKLEAQNYLVDPEDLGSIKDLASDARLNLVLKTNVEMAQGYGYWRQGQDPDVLDEYPALELYRLEDRDTPRGFRRGAHGALLPDPEHSWRARWAEAGDATGTTTGWVLSGARMVALVNHPIWDRLGDSTLFDDGLDNPYPPFAFNSGMDVRRVDRTDAESLGLLDSETHIQPQLRPFEMEEAA